MAQPVVIFTRDVVLRATLTSLNFVQREIEFRARDNAGCRVPVPSGGGGSGA